MKATRPLAAVAALATVSLLLTGCAQVHSGSAQRADGYDANTVNPALLDTGNYPTKPRDPLGPAGNFDVGRVLEAHRVADYTLLPFQADPTLNKADETTGRDPDPPVVIRNEASLAYLLGNEIGIEPAANHHRFVSGFKVAAANGDFDHADRKLSITVGVFATAAEATSATSAITDAANPAVDYKNRPYPTTAVTIPHHPETRAWVHAQTRTGKPDWHIVQAFTARGPFLLALGASTTDPAASAELIATALDQQSPLIDAFTPTPYGQLE